MAFLVGCCSSVFGPIGIIVGVGGSLAFGTLTAIQAANRRNQQPRKPIFRQQQDGEKDSSEVETYLRLGRVGKYKNLLSDERPFSKGEDGDKGYVEADHIPPLNSLRRAESYPEFRTLYSRNPVLHQMVISLRTDPQGRDLLTIQVATEHHRTALSTGSSRGSRAARDVVAHRIARGDVKTMLKQSFIIAHPFASQMIREDAGRSSRTPRQRILFKPPRTMDYYRRAFLRVVNHYFFEQQIILSDEEYKELVLWVRNDGYLDFDSSEYKEILKAVRDS